MNDAQFKEIWDRPIVRYGVLTMILASFMVFLPAVYLCVSEGIVPDISLVLKAFGMSVTAWGVLYVIEPVTYYAIVGLSGTYIAFLTGNLSNMRIPCAANALEVTGVVPGTREGEIVSTLGIAGSAITSITFTTLAALVGTQVLAMLPEPVVTVISSYTVPAIFGAVLGQFALKDLRIGVFSVAVSLFLQVVVKISPFYLMLACVACTIVFARFIYKYDGRKDADAAPQTV